MPLAPALEAELLLAPGAAYGSECLCLRVEVCEHAIPRGLGRLRRQHAVEDNENAARSPRAVHHGSRRVQHHCLLVLHPNALRKHLRHVQVDGIAQGHAYLTASQRQQRAVFQADLGHLANTSATVKVFSTRKDQALLLLSTCHTLMPLSLG